MLLFLKELLHQNLLLTTSHTLALSGHSTSKEYSFRMQKVLLCKVFFLGYMQFFNLPEMVSTPVAVKNSFTVTDLFKKSIATQFT